LRQDEGWRRALGAAAQRHMETYLADHRRALLDHLKRIGQTA
jgi:hypothetical protein